MTPDDADTRALGPATAHLIGLVRRSLGQMSLDEHNRGLRRFSARSPKPRVRLLSPVGVAAAGTALAAVAGSVVLVPRLWTYRVPLSYEIEAGAAQPNGVVQAGAVNRPRVRFSDGTEVQLSPGAHAHVASVTDHGATFVLDRGEVHARVVHWEGARWAFGAGPFVVTVTGTTFALSWTPNDDRLDLQLESGSVAVAGPVSDEPIVLHTGQWLTVRPSKREVLIRQIGSVSASEPDARSAAPPSPPAPEDAPSAVPSPALRGDAPAHREVSRVDEPGHDWAGLLATGKVNEIVSDAQRRGIDACLSESSSAELSALADAARYTKQGDLAKRALLAQRRRFPGTRRAQEGAFLLGRLAETNVGPARALEWFEKYLSETPNGAYASEALGRKMTIVQQTQGRARAEEVAQEYLRRFPDGTYAEAARAVLRTP